MNRVTRGVRTAAGLVLLGLLASTVTAGAALPTTGTDVPDAELAGGVSGAGGDGDHRGDRTGPADRAGNAAADHPPTQPSPARSDAAGTDTSSKRGDDDAKEVSKQPERQPDAANNEQQDTAGKKQQDAASKQSQKQQQAKKQQAKGDGKVQRSAKATSSGKGKGKSDRRSGAGRQVGKKAWAAFDWALGKRLVSPNHAVSVAVSVDGEIAHTAAFGERVAGQPAKPAHRFRIASISKVFTATAVLRLVDRGVLTLDKPVTGRVAKALGVTPVDRRAGRITVRQLLAHTSGLGGHDNEFFRSGVDSCSAAATVAFRRTLSRQPGTSHSYSNMNYCVLGLVLEHATGKPYNQVLNDEVLEPLGIDTMRVAGTFDVGLRDVRHPSSPGRNYMETLGAAGSWLATPSDIVTLMDSLDPATPGWHPLPNELVAEMKAPASATQPGGRALRRAGAPSSNWYGLGLMVYRNGSYGHTGTLERTHAMTVARRDGVTWAVTVSGETPSNSDDLRVIMDEALAAAGLG